MELGFLAVYTHNISQITSFFIHIYSRRNASWSADSIPSHARGQGGRGNLGEEGRGEARLQAAAAAAAGGTSNTPHSSPVSPFPDSLRFFTLLSTLRSFNT